VGARRGESEPEEGAEGEDPPAALTLPLALRLAGEHVAEDRAAFLLEDAGSGAFLLDAGSEDFLVEDGGSEASLVEACLPLRVKAAEVEDFEDLVVVEEAWEDCEEGGAGEEDAWRVLRRGVSGGGLLAKSSDSSAEAFACDLFWAEGLLEGDFTEGLVEVLAEDSF